MKPVRNRRAKIEKFNLLGKQKSFLVTSFEEEAITSELREKNVFYTDARP
jgi:hypothetical protein